MLDKEKMVIQMRGFFEKEKLPTSRTDLLQFNLWKDEFESFLKTLPSGSGAKDILNYTEDGGLGCLTLVGCVENFPYSGCAEIIDNLLERGAEFCPSFECLGKAADFSNIFDKFISVMDDNELKGVSLSLSGFSGNIFHHPEVLARYIGDCLHYGGECKSESKWLSECRATDGLPPIHVWWNYYVEGLEKSRRQGLPPGVFLDFLKNINKDRMIGFTMEALDVSDHTGTPLWRKIFSSLEKGFDFSTDVTFLRCGIIEEVERRSLQAKTLPATNKVRPHRL